MAEIIDAMVAGDGAVDLRQPMPKNDASAHRDDFAVPETQPPENHHGDSHAMSRHAPRAEFFQQHQLDEDEPSYRAGDHAQQRRFQRPAPGCK